MIDIQKTFLRNKNSLQTCCKSRQQMVDTWLLFTAAIFLTVLIAWLHWVRLHASGAFWRDEVNSIHTAGAASWSQLISLLRFESFPLLWFGLLRSWLGTSFGATDIGLRAMGMLVGLATLAAIWITARRCSIKVPVFGLVLFAFNPVVIIYGDSIRAYGFATFLAIIYFGSVWACLVLPSRYRWVEVMVVAVLCVQTMYTHAALILAINVSAAALCWIKNRRRDAASFIFVGVMAAVSLLPYLPIIAKAKSLRQVIGNGFSTSMMFTRMVEVLNLQHPLLRGSSVGSPVGGLWLIALLIVGSAILIGTVLCRHRDRLLQKFFDNDSQIVFASLALVLYILSFWCLHWFVQFPTQKWYYQTMLGLLAIFLDLTLTKNLSFPTGQRCLLAIMVAMTFASFNAVYATVTQRFTNVAGLAKMLEKKAKPNDLIIVQPYYMGVTFGHYYHGSSAWVSNPMVADLSVHRYDLVLENAKQGQASMLPLLAKVEQTLASGHDVWLISIRAWSVSKHTPVHWPLIVDGHDIDRYLLNIELSLFDYLSNHATELQWVKQLNLLQVNSFERGQLFRCRGFKIVGSDK